MKTVLECGAHTGEPNRLECTALLNSGLWQGVLLEPFKPRFDLLTQKWPGQICLPIGLSDIDVDSETYRTHRSANGKCFFGRSTTWDLLVETNDFNIDYAIIDVELMELKVLAGMTKRLPQRIMIEMHVDGIREALEAKGYKYERTTGVNGYFILG